MDSEEGSERRDRHLKDVVSLSDLEEAGEKRSSLSSHVEQELVGGYVHVLCHSCPSFIPFLF